MNPFLSRIATVVLLSAVALQTSHAAEAKGQKDSRWNLELLPRAFQKNPTLNITVLSEVSDVGKKRAPVSIENPVYYITHSGGYQARGEPMSQKPFPAAEVEKILQRALASSGYLPATAAHSPSIAIIYTWGAHNVVDPENATTDQVIRNVLDRAALAGGQKFAGELAKAIHQATIVGEASARVFNSGTASAPSMDAAMAPDTSSTEASPSSFDVGSAARAFAVASGLNDPVRRFKESSLKNDSLFNQATTNCYYIIASAFDYESLASPHKELLWRTRLTVNSDGVSQLEAVPMMITTAAPYLGKDMSESEIITKHAVQKGQVEAGTPTLAEPLPAPSEEKK